jgi:hypothetical protein
MEIIGYLGLVGSVALLIWMALRGVDIMFAAILSALVVIITNVMPLADSLLTGFAAGPLGALPLRESFSSYLPRVRFSAERWAIAVQRPVLPWRLFKSAAPTEP